MEYDEVCEDGSAEVVVLDDSDSNHGPVVLSPESPLQSPLQSPLETTRAEEKDGVSLNRSIAQKYDACIWHTYSCFVVCVLMFHCMHAPVFFRV